MVFKLCVACNHRVPGAKKTCVCGHVFTQTKMIGRRRYSGYRAMWYSRSDPRRKSLNKKTSRRLMIHEEKRVNKRLDSNTKPERRPSREMTAREDNLTSKSQQIQKATVTNPNIDLKSPELIRKFSEALRDINKRIARQSLLWIVLKSSKY